MSEATPLLVSQDDEVFSRFPPAKKRTIVAVIAWASIISRFAFGSFVPSIPDIAQDLNTTGAVINYIVSLYMFTTSIGILVWGRYSDFYGRRPVYVMSLPLLCIGTLWAAVARNVTQLAIGRGIMAFGAASVMSVGAATISDIYKLEERGGAFGVYLGAELLGPTLAPFLGGVATAYSSWRVMQLILFGMSLTALILVLLLLPETSHPGSRGVDQLGTKDFHDRKLVWLNPFCSLSLLGGPNVYLPTLAASTGIITDSVMLIPMSYTIGPAYGLTNPALIGACFLPSGAGSVLGAFLVGRTSDTIIIKARKRRNGVWRPEDRLLASLPFALILVPLSSLVYGISIQFISGKVGLVTILICLLANGIGVAAVIGPCGTYLVDIVHTRSAEVMAVSAGLKSVVNAVTAAVVLPTINRLGVATTGGLAAAVSWLGFVMILATIKYGSRLRAWKDIGYSVKEV